MWLCDPKSNWGDCGYHSSRFSIPAFFQREGDVPRDVWCGNQAFLFIARLCRTDHRGVTTGSFGSPCFCLEIYKTDNPQMTMKAFQLFIPQGWWSGVFLWKSLLGALKVKAASSCSLGSLIKILLRQRLSVRGNSWAVFLVMIDGVSLWSLLQLSQPPRADEMGTKLRAKWKWINPSPAVRQCRSRCCPGGGISECEETLARRDLVAKRYRGCRVSLSSFTSRCNLYLAIKLIREE